MNLRKMVRYKVDAYLIILISDLETIIRHLSQTVIWKPRAKFFIISEETPKKIFEVLLKYYVFNAVVLKKIGSTEIDIFTHFTYVSADSKIISANPVILDMCVSGFLRNNSNLFPSKIQTNWKNTAVRIALMHYPPYVIHVDHEEVHGIEIDVFKILQSKLGFKIEYLNKTYNNWGFKLPNGSYTDSYGDIQSHKSDLGIGAYHALSEEHLYFDMTFGYMGDEIKWVVPAAEPLKYPYNIFLVFTVSTWACLGVFLLSIASIMRWLSTKSSEIQSFKGFSRCLLMSLQGLLGNCVFSCPKTNAVRIVFGFWYITSWIFGAALHSKLLMVFSTTNYEPQVKSLKDILQMHMQFGYYHDIDTYFKHSTDPNEQFASQNYIFCPITVECVNKTAFERSFATVKTKLFLETLIPTYYLRPDGDSMLYIFETNIIVVPFRIFFTKGHPMFEQADKLLLHLRASGITGYFCRNVEQYTKRMRYYRNRKRKMKSKTLNHSQLKSVFTLWFFGILTSVACFVFELSICLFKNALSKK